MRVRNEKMIMREWKPKHTFLASFVTVFLIHMALVLITFFSIPYSIEELLISVFVIMLWASGISVVVAGVHKLFTKE